MAHPCTACRTTGKDLIVCLSGIHARVLQLPSQALDIVVSDIGNAATPGDKALDFDVISAINGAGAKLRFRLPGQASLGGNTVELATEQTAFAHNAFGYRASHSF